MDMRLIWNRPLRQQYWAHERHVTLSHEMWGSDQKASLEVHAMDMLNKRIQSVYDALGTGVKYMSESEAAQRKKLRTV